MRHVLAALAALAALIAFPASASAELISSSNTHLHSENKAVVSASPGEVYTAIGRIGSWWNPEHSFAGDADAMGIDLRPGGCFCETLADGGGIEHGRVVAAWPGRLVRLDSALGPLQGEAVAGRLSWTLRPVPGGTEIVQTYAVSGHVSAGMEMMAGPVDAVLTEQFNRLVASLRR